MSYLSNKKIDSLKVERDSPKEKHHEVSSRFHAASKELIENYAFVLVFLFVISIVLSVGSFFYSYSLNRKLDKSSELFERIRNLERGKRIEQVEERLEKIEVKIENL